MKQLDPIRRAAAHKAAVLAFLALSTSAQAAPPEVRTGAALRNAVRGPDATRGVLTDVTRGVLTVAPAKVQLRRTPTNETPKQTTNETTTIRARADQRLRAGDRRGALADYERVVQRQTSAPALWQLVGDLRAHFGSVDTAVAAWRSASALRPEDDRILERVTHGSIQLGDYATAAEFQARLVAVLIDSTGGPGSERNLRRHMANLAEIAALAGDFTRGEQAARQLIGRAPHAIDGHLALGYVQLHAGDFDDAEGTYLEVLKRDPNVAIALNNLGNIRYMRRDLDGAAELFETILGVEGASPYSMSIATSNLAELLQIQGGFDDASRLYKDAIDLVPTGAWSYMGLAALLDVEGRYDAATDAMIDGWERDKNRLTRLNSHFYEEEWAWQRDALIAEIEGDTDLAASLWTRVLAGDVELLTASAAYHLRTLGESTP